VNEYPFTYAVISGLTPGTRIGGWQDTPFKATVHGNRRYGRILHLTARHPDQMPKPHPPTKRPR
jgi:hypothetical protein